MKRSLSINSSTVAGGVGSCPSSPTTNCTKSHPSCLASPQPQNTTCP